jgi:hypothetical protein
MRTLWWRLEALILSLSLSAGRTLDEDFGCGLWMRTLGVVVVLTSWWRLTEGSFFPGLCFEEESVEGAQGTSRAQCFLVRRCGVCRFRVARGG